MPQVRAAPETLEELRTLLLLVAEDLAQAVAMGDHEVKQALHRLKFEQPQALGARVRVLERRWQEALSELRRKQSLPTPTGAPASTIVERRAAEKLKRELEATQARLEATKRWARTVEREAMLYRGQTAGARDAPRGLLANAAGHLGRLITDLEAYRAEASAPAAEADDSVRGGGADEADSGPAKVE